MERLKLHFMIAVIKLLMAICWKIDGYDDSLIRSGEYKYANDVTGDLQNEINKLL